MTWTRWSAVATLCTAALMGASPALGQAAYGAPSYALPGYAAPAETPAAILDRSLRTLAANSKDFAALNAAGKAAVAIGDTEAAAGFFARADEVNPRSPLPQAGMGAVAVANGEPRAALPYFARALQLGAAPVSIAADRGLAYDLLGNQQRAQADYRLALSGPQADDARRRLALSLAIGGDRAGALQTLAPLQARGDVATGRTRAFVLALTGDTAGAMAATDAAMPGSWQRVAPFLQKLARLGAAQKAAAVNLGIFPDSAGASLSVASTVPSYSLPQGPLAAPRAAAPPPVGDRLASIDELLRAPSAPPSAPMQTAPAGQLAMNTPTLRLAQSAPPPARPVTPAETRPPNQIWLQLATGTDPSALSAQFNRMRSRNGDLFEGIPGYVAQSAGRNRLVVGPFRSGQDARNFLDELQDVNISASNWTNAPGDTIVPLDAAS